MRKRLNGIHKNFVIVILYHIVRSYENILTGSYLSNIISAFARHVGGENIVYGQTEARDAILSFIIDDGVPHRGHRQNILNPNFRVVGVACGPHPVYQTVCVMIFADE